MTDKKSETQTDPSPTANGNKPSAVSRWIKRNANSSQILTPEEERLKYRLRWLVRFLFTVLIILVLVLIYAARTNNFDTPAIIVITCTLSSALTTVLGSIIGTTIQ